MTQPEIWSCRTVKHQMLPNFFKIPNYPIYPLTSSMRKSDYVHSKGTVVICICKSFHLRLKSLKYKPTQYVTLPVSRQEAKERVSNGRGEEGLVGGSGHQRRMGEARNVTLHKHIDSCTWYEVGRAKSGIRQTQLKKRNKQQKTNISHELLLTWLQIRRACLHLSERFLRWQRRR